MRTRPTWLALSFLTAFVLACYSDSPEPHLLLHRPFPDRPRHPGE